MKRHLLLATISLGSLFALGCPKNMSDPYAKDPTNEELKKKICPPEPETTALVIATIGDKHLSTNGYAFSRIGDVIDAYRPDVILVDVHPKMLKGDREFEAPLELAYIDYAAATKSTEVFAIGEVREDAPLTPKADKEDEGALAKEGTGLEDLLVGSFDEINGADGTRKVMGILNARARYLKGNPDWSRHEAWIEHQADAAMDVKKPSRVLLMTSSTHRGGLEQHMRQRGYGVKDPVDVIKTAKEERESNTVSEEVMNRWKRQADELRNDLRAVHPVHDRAWLEWRVGVVELALRRNGGCCVQLDEIPSLAAPDAKNPKKK